MLNIMLSEWVPYYRPLLNNKLILSEQLVLAAGKFRQRHSDNVSHFFREAKGNMFSVHTKGVTVDLLLLSVPCARKPRKAQHLSSSTLCVFFYSTLYSRRVSHLRIPQYACVCEWFVTSHIFWNYIWEETMCLFHLSASAKARSICGIVYVCSCIKDTSVAMKKDWPFFLAFSAN